MKDRLQWATENHFSINGINFLSTVDPSVYHDRRSDDSCFLLVKNRAMIECELDAVEGLQVRNVVDIGIWQGGSVALFDSVFAPRKLVALEFSDRDLPPLDNYIATRSRADAVRVYKGVDQADQGKLREVVQREFKGEPIDLVIDDASHFYKETKASFDVLFPRLRPGGKYVIEDWQWSTNAEVASMDYFEGKPGLSNLVLQSILLCATRPDIIASVTVHPHMAIVTRGAAADLTDLSIETFATNRGAPVPLLL
jgi:hypothetical protein